MHKKITTYELQKMKKNGEKISALTCYNFYMSQIFNRVGIDVILVGDSLGMVELGYDSTIPVTIDDMRTHLKAVRRGNTRALLVVDMPYMSYNFSRRESLNYAGMLMKDGAEAVKIEGGKEVKKNYSNASRS
ncbi:MAG: 3-methyl-2-oxobutanoate hydroxymethyltransferase [bacterium]